VLVHTPMTGAELRENYRAARERIERAAQNRRLVVAPGAPTITPIPASLIGEDAYAQLLGAWANDISIAWRPSGRRVCEIVSKHFGLSWREIIGESTARHLVRPRQIVMYICVRGFGYSHTQTGHFIGNRDHTTVAYGVRCIVTRMNGSPGFAAEMTSLMQACGC